MFLCCLLFCVRFSFFSIKPRDWLVRTSPKWPVLCGVGRKTSVNPLVDWLIDRVSVMCVCACSWSVARSTTSRSLTWSHDSCARSCVGSTGSDVETSSCPLSSISSRWWTPSSRSQHEVIGHVINLSFKLAATLHGSWPGVQSVSPKTPKNTSFLGVTRPSGVAQPLYSRGHN